MRIAKPAVTALVLAALLVGTAPEAQARRGNRDRVRETLAIAPASSIQPRRVRLEIRRRGLTRQIVKLSVERAGTDVGLDVFMTDPTGAIAKVADMRRDRRGRYRWRVRTHKGQALPFGFADVADLSGRTIQVVTDAGEVVAQATVPVIAEAELKPGKKVKLQSSMSVDGDGAEAMGGDEGVKARIRVRRKRDGREDFDIEVEHLPAGLTLEAYIRDADGVFHLIGPLYEELEDDGAEYELEIRRSDGGTLPLNAESVADLAGLLVEIRDADGTVLASGFVPDLGEPEREGDDDREGEDDREGDDDDHEGDDDREGDDDDHEGDDDDREGDGDDREGDDDDREGDGDDREGDDDDREGDDDDESDDDEDSDEDGDDGDEESDDEGEDEDDEDDDESENRGER